MRRGKHGFADVVLLEHPDGRPPYTFTQFPCGHPAKNARDEANFLILWNFALATGLALMIRTLNMHCTLAIEQGFKERVFKKSGPLTCEAVFCKCFEGIHWTQVIGNTTFGHYALNMDGWSLCRGVLIFCQEL